MIKYLTFSMPGFLILFASFLHSSQEEVILPKNIIKDLIIKYQIDEDSIYLTKLLSLPRTTINEKFSKSLEKYKIELQEYSDSKNHYATDLKETKLKIQEINTGY